MDLDTSLDLQLTRCDRVDRFRQYSKNFWEGKAIWIMGAKAGKSAQIHGACLSLRTGAESHSPAHSQVSSREKTAILKQMEQTIFSIMLFASYTIGMLIF